MDRRRTLWVLSLIAALAALAGLCTTPARADDAAPAPSTTTIKGPPGDDPISGEELTPEVIAASRP